MKRAEFYMSRYTILHCVSLSSFICQYRNFGISRENEARICVSRQETVLNSPKYHSYDYLIE